MIRKAVSVLMLTLLLTSMLTLAFNIRLVKASGTIYIRADGSIEGTTHIVTLDNVTYTFTDNIYDEIVVERDNIVVDGADFTLQGTGSGTGIYLSYRSNVTIKSLKIKNFWCGIYLYGSSSNSVSGNNITANNEYGIYLDGSSDNTVSGNNITNNHYGIDLYVSSDNTVSGNNITNSHSYGIYLFASSNCNSISGNNITNNLSGIVLQDGENNTVSGNNAAENNMEGVRIVSSSNITVSGNNIVKNYVDGITVWYSSNITVSGNNITNTGHGIWLEDSSNITVSGNNIANNHRGIRLMYSSNNTIYHNSFINNTQQVYLYESYNITWDDGYPSGGNYWSDYSDLDLCCGPNQNIAGSDGIWDHAYVIDANNQDNYPLTKPCVPGTLTVSIYTDKTTYQAGDTMHLGLNITNPDSVKYLCFAIRLELPDSSIYVYTHKHSVLLPIGLNYANPNLESITLPSIPSGNYMWHAAFLRRTTHTIVAADTAEWQFV